MFYHVLIETNEKIGKNLQNRKLFLLDKPNLPEIIDDVLVPYLRKEKFQFDGYFLTVEEIVRLVVYETESTTKQFSQWENENMPSGVIMFVSPSDILSYDKYSKDITKLAFQQAREKAEQPKPINQQKHAPELDKLKVFIVHGQDELAKVDVARFVEKIGLTAIILHEQVSSGNTIIEKIEQYSNVGFAVVLYTECDLGARKGMENELKPRARQNVVFEHGYMIAKLGRRNVCALVKGKVEIPNDISGVVYVPLDDHKAWRLELAKEMRNAGYDIDMNKVV